MTQQTPSDNSAAPNMLGRKIFFSCLIFTLIAGTAAFSWQKHRESLFNEKLLEILQKCPTVAM